VQPKQPEHCAWTSLCAFPQAPLWPWKRNLEYHRIEALHDVASSWPGRHFASQPAGWVVVGLGRGGASVVVARPAPPPKGHHHCHELPCAVVVEEGARVVGGALVEPSALPGPSSAGGGLARPAPCGCSCTWTVASFSGLRILATPAVLLTVEVVVVDGAVGAAVDGAVVEVPLVEEVGVVTLEVAVDAAVLEVLLVVEVAVGAMV